MYKIINTYNIYVIIIIRLTQQYVNTSVEQMCAHFISRFSVTACKYHSKIVLHVQKVFFTTHIACYSLTECIRT